MAKPIDVCIRPAKLEDAKRIYELSLQLGYSPTLNLVEGNIIKMLGLEDYELIVATDEFDFVLGWMTLAVRYRIEDVTFMQVVAVVTDEKIRGRGVGRTLMAYATSAAKKRGLTFVGLQSNQIRAEAHAFYDQLGYQKIKTSFFFRKDVT